jgi:hypothetical protein
VPYIYFCLNIIGVNAEGKSGMTKIQALMSVFEKALDKGYAWGEIDKEIYDELAEVEKVILFRALLGDNMYYPIIFDQDFAKALWGEGDAKILAGGLKHMTRDYRPEWMERLMDLVVAEDKLKYLSENMPAA